MSIFDDIAAGTDRLRRGEDLMIGRMRAAGADWRTIATALLTKRAQVAQQCEAMAATGNARRTVNAKRWRDEYRKEART